MDKKLFILTISILLFQYSKAQDLFVYINKETINHYKEEVSQAPKDSNKILQLASAYFYMQEYEKAKPLFKQYIDQNINSSKQIIYKYAFCLDRLNETKDAINWYNKIDKKFIETHTLIDTLSINQYGNIFQIENLKINSADRDFSISANKNGYLFTSDREGNTEKTEENDPLKFTDIYQLKNNGEITKLESQINSPYHESSAVESKDGKTLYFSRNNYDGKKLKSDNKLNRLTLYQATKVNGKWSNVKALPFNNKKYSCSHPCLSPDQKTLYFVSDMPNGYGSSDIYKVSILKNGTFSKPENLGPEINTSKRESFPFINPKNILYFASDNHIGFGGLDIFKVDLNGKKKTIENLGRPFNSIYDDFGLISQKDGKMYHLTSNRENGVGKDDLYKIMKRIDGVLFIGKIYDENKELISTVLRKLNNVEEQIHIDDMLCNLSFSNSVTLDVSISKKGYLKLNESIKVKSPNEIIETTFHLKKASNDKNKVIIDKKSNIKVSAHKNKSEQMTIGNTFEKITYFDTNSSYLTKKAKDFLYGVVRFLKENKVSQIYVESHADSRGTKKYNLWITERRANRIKDFMVSNGIPADKITTEFVGESSLFNDCIDGVDCSESQHFENRKTIISYKK